MYIAVEAMLQSEGRNNSVFRIKSMKVCYRCLSVSIGHLLH